MKPYFANVRLPLEGGVLTATTRVHVDAASPADAKRILEAQYGKGNVVSIPIERRWPRERERRDGK